MKKIVIFGATGFLGEAITDALIANNFQSVIFSRSQKEIKSAWKNSSIIKIEDLKDLDYKNHSDLYDQVGAIIYSVGAIKDTRHIDMNDLHNLYVKKTIEFAKNLNIKKFILVSANGVEHAATKYQKTKLEGEKALINSSLDYRIIRPSIIVDNSEKYNFINVLKSLIVFPIVPVIGNGKYKFQPIYRKDLADGIVSMIKGDEREFHGPRLREKRESSRWGNNPNILCACGSKVYTFKELLKILSKNSKIPKMYMHIPMQVMKLASKVIEKFPKAPITYDQLVMIEQNNICEDCNNCLKMKHTKTFEDIAANL